MKARIIREPRCALLWRIDETYPNYAAITRAAKRYDVKLRAVADGDSLVISGDYQRYFEYGGVRYAHLIDLTTGWPARYVSSVAVLAHADTGGLADALSTGLFCLPESTGQTLAAQNHYAVLWMHPDETTQKSNDWPQ